MDKIKLFYNIADSINSPFWAEGNMNAIRLDCILLGNNYIQDIKPDWVEFAENRLLFHNEIGPSIKQIVERYLHHIDDICLNESPDIIIEFLEEEQEKLKISITKESFRMFKKKLQKYEELEKRFPVVTLLILKHRCFWYQRLNMFIFGVRKVGLGSHYMSSLKTNLRELKEEKNILNNEETIISSL